MAGKNRNYLILAMVVIALMVTWWELGTGLVQTGSEPVMQNNFKTEVRFYETLEDGKVRCGICFRNCVIAPGERGFCKARENKDGVLYSLVYGLPSALQRDPVEKEPMFHVEPGSSIYCIGTASCNFRCRHCHNWHLSQLTIEEVRSYYQRTPQDLVREAKDRGMPAISFTYNEPTILYEYIYDTARIAQEEGIRFIFHTNGSMNPEPLRKLLPHVDAVTVDLKGFTEEFYREISQARLEPVLNTLEIIREEGVWLEIVNLVIPGFNDDPEEIREMCGWIKENLGSQTPIHFTRFTPAYRLTGVQPTPVETLEMAHRIAGEEGLEYVYIGNVPGHIHNSTFCPDCGETLIQRYHFSVHQVNIDEGKCKNCGNEIPGIWP